MTGAKICGLTTPEAVAAAVDGGAEYLGFMFFAKSPRDVTPEAAARLAEPARGRAKIVAVTVDPKDAELDAITKTLQPDLIQLHGGAAPARAAEVRERTGAGLISSLPIAERLDLLLVVNHLEIADLVMLDAKPPPEANRPGGLGSSFDWSLVSGLKLHKPWFLAGGLNASNVADGVRVTGAPLVDVSSGVESAPGLKDPALITAFLKAVRSLSFSAHPRESGDLDLLASASDPNKPGFPLSRE